jgi:membrane protein
MRMLRLARQIVVDLRRKPLGMEAAALAYYAAFSLAPLVLLLVRTLGWLVGQGEARERVMQELGHYAGDQTVGVIDAVLRRIVQTDSTAATAVALVTLAYGASSMFATLQNTLNREWGERIEARTGRSRRWRKRLLSFLMVLGASLVLVTSILLSAVLSVIERWFAHLLPAADVFQLANTLVSFVLVTAVFALIYRFVPDAAVRWPDVWLGALTASILYAAGRELLGLYFRWSAFGSAYVAAGSLLAVLMWLYYSAQVLLVGARITRAHADLCGSPKERGISHSRSRQEETHGAR